MLPPVTDNTAAPAASSDDGLGSTSSTPGASEAVEAPDVSEAKPRRGYSGTKEEYLKRLRRIEGQVRGIARMVDDDTYCIDVLTQVSAVTKALQSVSIGLVEDHIGHCVVNAAKSSDAEGNEKVAEAAAAIARLVRS